MIIIRWCREITGSGSCFKGANYNIGDLDLEQDQGRIWVGDVAAVKEGVVVR